MHSLRQDHWDAALRVVWCSKCTHGQGILLRSSDSLTLTGWCDFSWVSCPLTRRSLLGWIMFLGPSLISWKTMKQHTIFLYRGKISTHGYHYYRDQMVMGLTSRFGSPPWSFGSFVLWQLSALHIAQNLVFHECIKHIEVDCHCIRDAFMDGLLNPYHVSTHEQLVEIFTKLFAQWQF